jgi:arylsulfatase A-like enzyme
MKKPHLVIFNPDQWRGDVMGHMGNKAAHTPNLDALAETEGVSFRNAFCQNPVCTPSRCSFMSGWYPHVRGHRTLFHMMRPDEPVILRTLKEEGYYVWWGGKNDLVPAENGFEDYCHVKYEPPKPKTDKHVPHDDWRGSPDSDSYYSFYRGKRERPFDDANKPLDDDWACIQAAIELIQTYSGEQPLCIYLPLQFPHPPYGVEEPYFSMIDRGMLPPRVAASLDWEGKPSLLKGIYDTQRMQGWSEERWDELRATYYGMCARVDEQFGLVLDALKANGMYDDTSVFFFSDHGDFTGDYGLVEKTQNTFEDCLTRVPFVVKPPAWIETVPGIREALVELIDFPATVEAMAGIKPKHSHFGRSLISLLTGETDVHRDAVFCEGGRLHGEEHCKELEVQRTPELMYYPRLKYQWEEGPEHTKAIMIRTDRYKYVRRLYESDELYDLNTDPTELVNRVKEPEYASILLQLKEKLLTFYMETADVVPHDINKRK